MEAGNPKLSPDGQSIVYVHFQRNQGPDSPVLLMRVPTSGGPSRRVLEARIDGYRCSKAPATLCLFAEHSSDQKQLVFTAFEPEKGRGHELARFATDPT